MSKFIPKATINELLTSNRSHKLLEGIIQGATPLYHNLEAGHSIELTHANCYHILLLYEGNVAFLTNGETYSYSTRMVFVPDPAENLIIKAETDAKLLEIKWDMKETDAEELASYKTSFPIQQIYADSMQYKDPTKSKKTIERSVIAHRIIPRFCMGSVESYGYDKGLPHSHPMLDQFFFTFPENDMDLIIDGESVHIGGNVLLYIPLGSEHGVEVFEGKHLHYMWIDFFVDDTSLAHLDKRHIPTGTIRSFSNEDK